MSTVDSINLAIAIAAGTSAIIAACYTIVTFRILKVNQAMVAAIREQSLAQMRPYIQISAFFRTGTQLAYLLIKNTGRTSAINLRLTLEPEFYVFGDKSPDRNLASFAAFSQAIECFAPGAELQFILGNGPQLFSASADRTVVPLTFDVVANYAFESVSVAERTTVDLKPYLNAVVQHDPIVEELERLRNVLEALAKNVARNK